MTARARLESAARELGADPSGVADRDLALAVLAAFDVDLEAQVGLHNATPLRAASTEHLMRRAAIVAETTERLTFQEQATVDATLGTVEAIRWLRARGLVISFDAFARARRDRRIPHEWIRGEARFRVDDLDAFARSMGSRS